jgi:hypothetical protein
MARPRNEERALIAERRTRVLAMRVEQRPYTEIAAALGISEQLARTDYARAVEARRTELDSTRAVAVAIEQAKLDAVEQAAWKVLRARHITVQQGKIVGKFAGFALVPDTGEVFYNDDGKPIPLFEEIEDDAPVLQAIDRILKIADRRAKLTGLDAPTKVDVSDERRAEIEKYAAELAAGLGDVDPEGAGAAPGDAEAG